LFSPEISQRILQQFLDIWIMPEIKKRISAKSLPSGFVLRKAQVVMFPDERKSLVRLNDEVRAIISGKATRPINQGEMVTESDISEIMSIQLTDEDPADAGHFTGLIIRGEWVLQWDFRYNRGKSKQMLNTAQDYLKAARRLLEGQNIKPFVDVLYSTVELLATAQLLIVPDPKYTKKQTHASTQIKYSGFTKLGNFKPEYATTLNKLSGLRDQARYLKGDLYISEGDCRKYLEIVEDMLKYTEKIIT